MNDEEIAREVGLSVERMKSRRDRAMKELRELAREDDRR